MDARSRRVFARNVALISLFVDGLAIAALILFGVHGHSRHVYYLREVGAFPVAAGMLGALATSVLLGLALHSRRVPLALCAIPGSLLMPLGAVFETTRQTKLDVALDGLSPGTKLRLLALTRGEVLTAFVLAALFAAMLLLTAAAAGPTRAFMRTRTIRFGRSARGFAMGGVFAVGVIGLRLFLIGTVGLAGSVTAVGLAACILLASAVVLDAGAGSSGSPLLT